MFVSIVGVYFECRTSFDNIDLLEGGPGVNEQVGALLVRLWIQMF